MSGVWQPTIGLASIS